MSYLSILQPKLLTRAEVLDLLRDRDVFYAYILWRTDKAIPEPFYVGKGHNGRILQHTCLSEDSNPFKYKVIRKTGEPLFSLDITDTEEEAHDREIELIQILGRRNTGEGPLTNLTDGGEGNVGWVGLRGGDNPRARELSIDGVTYPSATEASTALRIKFATIYARCRVGWPAWFFTDEGQRDPQKKLLLRYRRSVIAQGRQFPSVAAAARTLGVGVGTIRTRIASGHPGYRYTDEDPRPRRSNEKPVEIDGVRYPSTNKAAEALGLTKGCLRKRFSSSAFPTYRSHVEKTEVDMSRQPKAVAIGDKSYPSIADAARALDLTSGAILHRAASSNYPDVRIAGIEKTQRGPEATPVTVTVDGIEYVSQSEAARAAGIDVNTLKKRCASPAFPGYHSSAITIKKPKDGKPPMLRVEIDGDVYRSVNAAHKALGVQRHTIRERCASAAYPTYRLLEV